MLCVHWLSMNGRRAVKHVDIAIGATQATAERMAASAALHGGAIVVAAVIIYVFRIEHYFSVQAAATTAATASSEGALSQGHGW
jgi:hypothetical protein